MSGHIPMRMCVVCKKRRPKSELLRYTRAADGAAPVPDVAQKAPGRGVYHCPDAQCGEAFAQRGAKRKKRRAL
ncbi:MAG: YlxR family protein [Desulfovibrio sp.]|nr:YlxR family protein [Desulfovibrio sp.]